MDQHAAHNPISVNQAVAPFVETPSLRHVVMALTVATVASILAIVGIEILGL